MPVSTTTGAALGDPYCIALLLPAHQELTQTWPATVDVPCTITMGIVWYSTAAAASHINRLLATAEVDFVK